MIDSLINGRASNLPRFGNLMARCRREARRIIAGGGPNMRYRLGLVGERLMCAFDEIDARTTLEQRLMLIGANPADARDVEPGRDSMLYLLWGHNLEWSAMRRGDEYNEFDRAPLYWAVGFVMLDAMATDEARPGVDAAIREAFGGTFGEWATRGNT
ncbi:hypothetical protein [Burkholderia diffusa]|uniref:hypothetical protein n=1 Tax=Burkholderia diffusa TaxID=488732 RepID=UPI002ABE7758|nr:hypothetical protein [Burkholderia diffusa]